MLFHIKHITRYTYSRMVFCEPLIIRLRPREDILQRLMRYQLTVDPQPAGITEYLDVDGNIATQCWFSSPTCALSLGVNSVVETTCINPFNFLLDGAAVELPVKYRPDICPVLTPYRITDTSNGSAVTALVDSILAETNRQTIPFLTALACWISTNCQKTIRLEGDAFPAETTLQSRQGTCRDLAVLFGECCRAAGLAARFVSGYQSQLEDDGDRYLHAWSEVYLPGAGWRGFDPGQGVAVADRHVAVAAGLNPLAAAPTIGSFRGTDASSTMQTQLVIRVSS
ncbi:MAG TPA: transglutaminase family protein [Pirellulales bacterium]|jgi:transglutaminase-like putative cysteine protease|nr:transglutaminase family protein [Pirellulales bacterium]